MAFRWQADTLRALLRYAFKRSSEHRLPEVAGSLTFTTVLALVPMITVAFALFTAFPKFDAFRAALQGWLFQSLIPDSISKQILTYLNQFSSKAKGLTTVGLMGLGLTSIMTLLTVEKALNSIWAVRRQRRLAQRVLVFWALISIGPLLIGGSLSVSSYLVSVSAGYVSQLPFGLNLLVGLIPIGLSAIAFALLYSFVPNTRVEWRDAFTAGMVAAVAFEFAKRGFGYFITHFPTYTAVYGAFAALPIFLLWIYLSWLVTLLGAALAANLPVVRQGLWRYRRYAGADFFDVLGVMHVLYHAREQMPRGASELTLSQELRLEMAHLHRLLLRLKTLQLAAPLETDKGPVRWSLICDPAHITLDFLYGEFVLDLARLPKTALGRLMGEKEEALAASLRSAQLDVSLDYLFRQSQPMDTIEAGVSSPN